MRYNLFKFSIVTLLILLSSGAWSQESVFYNEPGRTYRQAMDLFTQKAYGPAGKLFDEYIKEKHDKDDI